MTGNNSHYDLLDREIKVGNVVGVARINSKFQIGNKIELYRVKSLLNKMIRVQGLIKSNFELTIYAKNCILISEEDGIEYILKNS